MDEYLRQSLNDLPSEIELAGRQQFTPRFERRMQRLLRKAARLEALRFRQEAADAAVARRTVNRTQKRLLMAAIILAILVSIIGVAASRKAVYRFVIDVYDRFSHIGFTQDPQTTLDHIPAETLTDDGLTALIPDYLPEGFKLVNQLNQRGVVQMVFANENGAEIIALRFVTGNVSGGVDITGTCEQVLVNGAEGYLYSHYGQQTLIFLDGDSGEYFWSLTSTITKEELLKVARSIK